MDAVIEFFKLFIKAAIIDNVVFIQYLAICPFIGMTNDTEKATGMGLATTFVIILATAVTWPIYNLVMVPLHLEFLQTLFFILVIASLVQLVEFFLKKTSPGLYNAMGVYLALITTNCAVLAITINCIKNNFSVFINGGLVTSNKKPIGVTISNGNIITSEIVNTLTNWYIGINKDTNRFECGKLKNVTLEFLKNKYDNVLTSFVPLIINGKLQDEETLKDCPNYNDKNPRQILCQKEDGTVIIITSDGRRQSQKGWTLLEAQQIIKELNVDFAFNLDGGGSAQTVYRNTLISTPIDGYHSQEREVFSCFGFKIGNIKNQKDDDVKDLSHMIGNLKSEIDYAKNYNIFDRGYISLKFVGENQNIQGIEVHQDNMRTNKLQLSKNKLYYFNTENETSSTIFSVDDSGVITTQKGRGHIQNDIAGTGGFEPDNINITGMYWFLAQSLGISGGASAYALQHIQSGSITALQIATPYSNNASHKCKRRRRNTDGTWTNWVDNN